MLRGSAGRASTSATVTRSLQLCRGYAEDGADLHGLAKRIESGISNAAGNAAARTLQPLGGFARSQLAKLSARENSQLPADFIPFEPTKPYNPYDFTPENRTPPAYRRFPQGAPSRAIAVRQDVFHQLEIDPLNEVLNCSLISYHTTEMGRIQRRSESKLTWKSQRKMGKAVRRARAMGLIPSFSRWKDSMVRIT